MMTNRTEQWEIKKKRRCCVALPFCAEVKQTATRRLLALFYQTILASQSTRECKDCQEVKEKASHTMVKHDKETQGVRQIKATSGTKSQSSNGLATANQPDRKNHSLPIRPPHPRASGTENLSIGYVRQSTNSTQRHLLTTRCQSLVCHSCSPIVVGLRQRFGLQNLKC